MQVGSHLKPPQNASAASAKNSIRFQRELAASLGVRFPLSGLNTVSTAAELVGHDRNRAGVHLAVPVESPKPVQLAVRVVDVGVVNCYRDPIVFSLSRKACHDVLRLLAVPKRRPVSAIHLARRSRLASGRFRRSPNS